jgi:CO/xanthine dehydrogenase FAD-binding subunit
MIHLISFDYYKPTSIKEATELHQNLTVQGRSPLYYAGGTEILTFGRLNLVFTDAVIDLKGIPECNAWGFHKNKLITGATLPLSTIEDQPYFTFLC